MNLKDKLTIIIPCRNEENYIDKTITSIVRQNGIKGVRIIIADGNSTDKTRDRIEYSKNVYKDMINIELIEGGKVAYGRNAGFKLAKTKYVLFMDADTTLLNNNTISDAMGKIEDGCLHLVTCKIKSTSRDIRSKLIFALFNPVNWFISRKTPFSTGTFFLTRSDEFKKRKGFDETLQHSEDYALSKTYNPRRFKILRHYIGQDDRRFKKMGYINMLKLVITNYLHKDDLNYFKKDVSYWSDLSFPK